MDSDEFKKFIITINNIEVQREFDRKVDRLKKSSSATTFWAILGGIFGIYGIAQFYLNKPLEGLLMLLVGFSLPLITIFLTTLDMSLFYNPLLYYNSLGQTVFFLILLYVIFFIANLIWARHTYSEYDTYIHYKAKKPWNNWGFNSQI